MLQHTRNAPSLSCLILAAVLAACTDNHDPVVAGDEGGGPAPQPSALFTLVAPVFGLTTGPDGTVFAAHEPGGVVQVRHGATSLFAALPGVSDIAAIGGGALLAITGEPWDPADPTARRLFRVSKGNVREIADLGAFEAAVNPDQVWNSDPPDSNPFSIAHLSGGRALVADAGGNSILLVDEGGSVDWVAVLTPQLASTDNFKSLIGCDLFPAAPPCQLPPAIPAQPVPTAVAIGPDGGWYVGELTGFPAQPGISRVWRIQPGSRHVLCPSDACTLVATGFTSIMDLAFGPDGTLYVVEYDASSWLATVINDLPYLPAGGGRIQSCNPATGSCVVRAAGLALPTAITFGRDGALWVAENDAIAVSPAGTARIRAVP